MSNTTTTEEQESKNTEDRKFWIFVKTMDLEEDIPVFEKCGWFAGNDRISQTTKDAILFTQSKKTGANPESWIKIVGEGHPEWILSHRYSDDPPFDPFSGDSKDNKENKENNPKRKTKSRQTKKDENN